MARQHNMTDANNGVVKQVEFEGEEQLSQTQALNWDKSEKEGSTLQKPYNQ